MDEELQNLKQQAIQAALNNTWPEAISLNETILKQLPKDIETLNRLGRAYLESGNLTKAKSTYKHVLEIDPYNTIAAKNIAKLASLSAEDLKKAAKGNSANPSINTADLFLEEPGKTKVIELVDLAMPKVLATLHTGDHLEMEPHNKDVTVSGIGKRIGKLPPEYAEKINEAFKAGSKFTCVVKAVIIKKGKVDPIVSIFVRETEHGPRLGASPLFPTTGNNHNMAFVREDTLPLMDTRDHLILESDEEIDDSTPSIEELTSEVDENDHSETPIIDDEEDFQPN